MGTTETLINQLEKNLQMVTCLLHGLNESSIDFKPTPRAMSIRDHVAHLTECHFACEEYLRGEDHEWGSYVPPNPEFKAIVSRYFETRTHAIELLINSESEKALEMLSDFIVLHEPYHIGQMSLNRQGNETEWDSFSLYETLEPDSTASV